MKHIRVIDLKMKNEVRFHNETSGNREIDF